MQYTLENDYLNIEISPRGAELMSIIGKPDGYQYLWQGSPQIWGKRAPLLFPIVGHLNQGKYRYQGREYAMGLHGFASQMDFSSCEAGENSIVFSLCHNIATLSQYPFQFRLVVIYTLLEKRLTTMYRVENTEDQTLWFSIGGHPAFNCSLNQEGRKDCRLVFAKPETVNRLVNESGYLTGQAVPFLKDQNVVEVASLDFDGKTKVYPLKGLRSESVTLEDHNNGKTVRLGYAGFPFLGIWSPSNRAPLVCIEPWCGITATVGVEDVLNQKQGIQRLGAGGYFSCSYDMTFN
jgi:galactose mutarotase-like enzyme